MRKILKILHTLAACGLIGGFAVYIAALGVAPKESPEAYANVREAIVAISRYILMPSLGIAIATGFFAMAVHHPFQEKSWAWVKALMGFLMFNGVLSAFGAQSKKAAELARDIANGEAAADALQKTVSQEWLTLWIVVALGIANVILGVWRPRSILPKRSKTVAATGQPSEGSTGQSVAVSE